MENNTPDGLFPTEKEDKKTDTTMTIPSQVIFFDVETVPLRDVYDNSPTTNLAEDALRIRLARYGDNNPITKMGLYPEFSKIICISVGLFMPNGEKKVQAITGEEQDIIKTFARVVEKATKLVGHNAILFDAPFIERRCIILGLKIPEILRSSALDTKINCYKNKKPRETKIEDTMQLWKGTAGSSSGLETICMALGLPTPKQTMDGSMVGEKYYASISAPGMIELFSQQVSEYCNADVMATMDIYKRILAAY